MSGKRISMVVAIGVILSLPRAWAEEMVIEGSSERATLVELYSSEGCSSCPPAEKWISGLKNDSRLWKQVVPVVFHVDYWDGLGWPDRFARKSYTQRQSDYQVRWGSGTVATPEFIVNGSDWPGWFYGGKLPMAKADAVGALRITLHDKGEVTVMFKPVETAESRKLTLNVAWLGMGIVSNVHAGENSGRNLTHDFVVLDWQSKVGAARGGDYSAEFAGIPSQAGSDRPGAIVAWVSADDGSILQAAGGLLK